MLHVTFGMAAGPAPLARLAALAEAWRLVAGLMHLVRTLGVVNLMAAIFLAGRLAVAARFAATAPAMVHWLVARVMMIGFGMPRMRPSVFHLLTVARSPHSAMRRMGARFATVLPVLVLPLLLRYAFMLFVRFALNGRFAAPLLVVVFNVRGLLVMMMYLVSSHGDLHIGQPGDSGIAGKTDCTAGRC